MRTGCRKPIEYDEDLQFRHDSRLSSPMRICCGGRELTHNFVRDAIPT